MPNLLDPEAPGERDVLAKMLGVQEVPKVAVAAARIERTGRLPRGRPEASKVVPA